MASLNECVKALLAHCDGAVNLDGRGFNKFDAQFARDLDAALEWTPRQSRAAWLMLRKYSAQLTRQGIDYAAIPEPEKTALAPMRIGADNKNMFIVAFPYDAALVAAVRDLPERRFFSDGDKKYWTVPAKPANIPAVLAFAERHGFEVTQAARDLCAKLSEAEVVKVAEQAQAVEASRAESSELSIEGLGGELRPFQRAGVAYALKAKRCFIADEMGLGKTVEALATIHAAGAYPALVVCPASLKLNWKREAEKWLLGKRVAVLNGKVSADLASADVVVLNYDILKKWKLVLAEMKFQAVVYDESHYLKNHKAQRTVAARELAKSAPIRLALTGTPVLNRPQELLSQLQILGRLNDVGGFWEFAKRYCAAYKSHFGWDFSGAAHLDELNEKLRATCFVRRTKADVLKELPAKTRAVQPVALDNETEYRRAERDVARWLGEQAANDAEFTASIADLPADERKLRKAARASEAASKARQAEQLVRIEALKQVAARGKLRAVQEWVESFLETGEKLVLFAHHREIVEALAVTFSAPAITGGTPVEERQAIVDKFQTDPACALVVCNIQAGGVGITLTAASNVAFCELAWNPAAHDQAEDRTHRIGQTGAVTAWYLLAAGTIDDDIYSLIEAKREVVDAATDGADAQDINIQKELANRLLARN